MNWQNNAFGADIGRDYPAFRWPETIPSSPRYSPGIALTQPENPTRVYRGEPGISWVMGWNFSNIRPGYRPAIESFQFLADGYVNDAALDGERIGGGGAGWSPPGLGNPGGPPGNVPPNPPDFEKTRPYWELVLIPELDTGGPENLIPYFFTRPTDDPLKRLRKIVLAGGISFRGDFVSDASAKSGIQIPPTNNGNCTDFWSLALFVQMNEEPVGFQFTFNPKLLLYAEPGRQLGDLQR